MSDTEHLRLALAERERLLSAERIALAHARTLLATMDVMNRNEVPEEGLRDVLGICREAIDADMAVLFASEEGGRAHVRATTDPECEAVVSELPDKAFSRCRCFADLGESDLGEALAGFGAYRSLLSVPLLGRAAPPMVLLLFGRDVAQFSRFDVALARRVGAILENTIDRAWLANRNSVLARIVDDKIEASIEPLGVDASFDALSRVHDRAVDWQGRIIDITNEILGDRSGSVDHAIDRALARSGELAGADRTYVFRLRPPDRIDNTHEWVAPGIEPMIEHLQDMPADLLDDWRPALEAGQPEYIPDIDALPDGSKVKDVLQIQGIRSLLAVPMLQDGTLTGFVGYDAVRSHRSFLPFEIQLLQSVANAIGVVLDRAEAEMRAAAAIAQTVRERKRMEATLSGIPYLVLDFDSQGRFEGYRNGGNAQPIVPSHEAVGRLPEDFLPDHLARLTRHMMTEADRHGQSVGHEYTLDIEGEERWFEASGSCKFGADGTGEGYVFVVRDITERHLRQQELRRLSRIAELTSNYVIITNADGRIEWVNPAFEQRSGWRLDELRGRKPGEILQNRNTDPLTVQRIGRSLRQEASVTAELLNVSRGGEEYWVKKDIQPLRDEAGRLEGFVSVQTDITSMQQSYARAMELRAQALDAASDGIGITDDEGFFIYLNTKHRTMFGIGPNEDSTAINWRHLYPEEEHRRIMEQAMPRIQAEGSWSGRTRGIHRDGTIIEQDVMLSATEDGGILCITRDRTRQRQIELERDRLREQLYSAQRRETVSQLAAGIAHDLNNLVAVVSGTVEVLQPQCESDRFVAEGLDRISRSMEAARDLVARLSATSRPPSAPAFVDLRRIVADAVDLLGAERRDRHSIEIDEPSFDLPVFADRTAVLQVVLNLTLNACESGHDARVRIIVGSQAAGYAQNAPDVGSIVPGRCYAYFSIVDTGEGIAPSIRPRLFERYMTTKGNAGTGLGLPIVAGILKDHGGVLWVDSAPGRGTAVTVAWPVEQTTARVGADVAAARVTVDPLPEAGRVLVVDDVPDMAKTVSDMLEEGGFEATVCTDASSALKLLEAKPGRYDCVVTDLDMPDMDGVEFARAASTQDPKIPIILVTALPGYARAHASVFYDILEKPVEASGLVQTVRGLLQARKR